MSFVNNFDFAKKEASRVLSERPETSLYSNSENALSWLEGNLVNSDFSKYAQLFKDKIRFRGNKENTRMDCIIEHNRYF